MRVISGSKRGTKLFTIPGNETRPTTDRIKESIFNLIQFNIADSVVLDLFSGSCALGIEAASRGAKSVTAVEVSRKCHEVINENIKKCGFESKINLIKSDVLRALTSLKGYDLIIMDPPYEGDYETKVLEMISKEGVLNPGGLVLVEHKRSLELADEIGLLKKTKTKYYGITGITIFAYDG
jgi:16S rRNA (guanine(966)-N(2))-methyltransferase RsmD